MHLISTCIRLNLREHSRPREADGVPSASMIYPKLKATRAGRICLVDRRQSLCGGDLDPDVLNNSTLIDLESLLLSNDTQEKGHRVDRLSRSNCCPGWALSRREGRVAWRAGGLPPMTAVLEEARLSLGGPKPCACKGDDDHQKLSHPIILSPVRRRCVSETSELQTVAKGLSRADHWEILIIWERDPVDHFEEIRARF